MVGSKEFESRLRDVFLTILSQFTFKRRTPRDQSERSCLCPRACVRRRAPLRARLGWRPESAVASTFSSVAGSWTADSAVTGSISVTSVTWGPPPSSPYPVHTDGAANGASPILRSWLCVASWGTTSVSPSLSSRFSSSSSESASSSSKRLGNCLSPGRTRYA